MWGKALSSGEPTVLCFGRRRPAIHGLLRSARKFVIGVGRDSHPASPSLRTGRADLPHPALRSVVLPARGLANRAVGSLQAEQPMFGKEAIWPSRLIRTAHVGDPLQLLLLAQQTPQSAAYPAIQRAEGPRSAVLEVAEPAPQRRIEVVDHPLQATSRRPHRLRPNGVLELLQALRTRPAPARLEAIPEELKPIRPRVHQPGLGRIEPRSGSIRRKRSAHCSVSPACAVQSCTAASAPAASSGLRHNTTKSSAERTIWNPLPAIRWSSGSR